MRLSACFSCLAALAMLSAAAGQDRETKVRNDRREVEGDGFWIYNNLPAGFGEAKQSGKPLLVVFRCIPCEACAQLDSEVVERDPLVRELLDQFVCVRVVHANGLDLSRFQFDYDQSWAAFFLNADGTIYGRYGTRSHQTESKDDVSLEGFAKALQRALKWHADYPRLKESLAGKTGPRSDYKSPEEMPKLKGKYTAQLDYEGKVVGSCIHCHQVGEAIRHVFRDQGRPLPETVLYPYPNPKILGLILDPKECVRVKEVAAGSPAEKDGFQAGDEIVALEGQPLLSIADMQWVLHRAGAEATLAAEVLRDGQRRRLPLTLAEGWRAKDDISWRATSWELRRLALGGLLLEDLSPAERREAGLDENALALRAKHVGQYSPHDRAKQAGIQKGDVLVAIDGREQRMTESEAIAWLINGKKPGDKLPVEVLRGRRRLKMEFPIQ